MSGPTPPGVLGLGADLVDVAAFARQLALPGTRFADAFTARERRQAAGRARAAGAGAGRGPWRAGAEHLAVRWAAKEAAIKAWSQALGAALPPLSPEQVEWREIECVCDRFGRPALQMHGRVATAMAHSLAPARPLAWHVSLSHDGAYALAVVALAR